MEVSPSEGDIPPASVTAWSASGWLAKYCPVAAATVPMALLSADAVHRGCAAAVGAVIVLASRPQSGRRAHFVT